MPQTFTGRECIPLLWALVLLSTPAGRALAQVETGPSVSLQLTLASRHYVSGTYNEVNPGLLVSVGGRGRWSFRAVTGLYRNSYSVTSLVLGAGLSWQPSPYVRLSATFGAATGYSAIARGSPYGAIPSAVQFISVGPSRIKFTLFHVPGAVGVGVMIPNLWRD